jgi:hypothetical protein
MSDINEKIDKKKDTLKIKSIRKKTIKSSKNKENAKNDNVMLTKIEELIDKKNKNFKDETCILKNLNKLFLNENESENNNLIGYSIDGKRNTVLKFNRSPSLFAIEQFRFPSKEKEKEKNDNFQIIKSKSKKRSAFIYRKNFIDKIESNNMTENADNKENINLMKKFKDNYQSEDDEKHKSKKMNSNVTRKLNKDTKEHILKNTMLVKHSNLNNILEFESNLKSLNKAGKELKSKRKQKSKKDEKIKKEEKNISEENNKNKEKEILKQDSNNYIIPKRRENKSKTRKQRRVSFHCGNLQKNMIKEINQNYLLNNNNIKKLEITKKSENDEEKVNKNFVRKRSKSKHINRKSSLHNYHFDFDKDLKLKKPKDNKSKLFQSVLFPKKSSLLEPKNKDKDKEENENSDYYTNNNDKSKINISSSSDSVKTVKKSKSKKKKNQMNLKMHKKESIKNVHHSIVNTSNYSNLVLNDSSQIKGNIFYRNNIKNLFEYKMKHVNHFCIKSLNKINRNKSSIIKLPFFSVVKPDKLVSIEYTRAYENNNRSFCLNKVSEDKLTREHKNNDRNENEDYKVEKRNKSFFCCL